MSFSVSARALWLAAAAAVAPYSAAQPAAPDPASASAPVPPVKYSSLLAGYRPFGDAKPTPWREANDTVTRIGGWRVYAREAQQPDAASAAPAAPATKLPAKPSMEAPEASMPSDRAKPMPMPVGHTGHKAP